MKKIILMIVLILCSGCGKKELLKDVVKIGDYVKYEIGTYTQEELKNIKTEERPSVHGEFGLYGMKTGDSKSLTISKGCYSDNFTESNNGWRVIAIKGKNVILVHAGTPLCYYHASGLRAKESIESIDNFINKMYLNEKYALEARNIKCEDITIDGTCDLTQKNINIEESLYKTNDYYFFSSAFDNIRLFNYEVYIDDFGRSHDISFGLRPVIILKENIKYNGKGDGSKESPYQITN